MISLGSAAASAASDEDGAGGTPVTIPDSDDTTIRANVAPQPGWTNGQGSCDTSSPTQWGYNGSTWVDGPYPPPGGSDFFMSCGNWDPESSFATITGLTPGQEYSFTFHVAGFREAGSFGAATGDSYRVTVGDDDSGFVSYSSVGWIEQSFLFTADAEEERIEVFGPAQEGPFRISHFSFGGDAVAKYPPEPVEPAPEPEVEEPAEEPAPEDPPAPAPEPESNAAGESLESGEPPTLALTGTTTHIAALFGMILMNVGAMLVLGSRWRSPHLTSGPLK